MSTTKTGVTLNLRESSLAWQSATEPKIMLGMVVAPSPRLLRLWLAACARIKNMNTEARYREREDATPSDGYTWLQVAQYWIDRESIQTRHILTPEIQCHLFREIWGDPFRHRACERCEGEGHIQIDADSVYARFGECGKCDGVGFFADPDPIRPKHRTSDVVGLARRINDDRRWDLFPVLRDALLEADCEAEDVLHHLKDEFLCPACSHGKPGFIQQESNGWYAGGGGWCSFCDQTGPELHWMTATDAPPIYRWALRPRHHLGNWVIRHCLGEG